MADCPYIGFQIEGRRPLAIERRKYDAVTRKLQSVTERLEQMPNGEWSLVIEHKTGNVRGTYRFYDIVSQRYAAPFSHHVNLKIEIGKWAARKRKSFAAPKLDARGKLIAKLEREIRYSYRSNDATLEDTNTAMLASLRESI